MKDIENGILFSRKNIYPNIKLDNTFKILKKADWLVKKISALENKHNLNKGDLGKIQ